MTEPEFTSRLGLLSSQWLLLKIVFLVPVKEANLIGNFLFPSALQPSLGVCISHVIISVA